MKDDMLDRALRGISLPAPSEEARAKALARALVALSNSDAVSAHRHGIGLRWILATGAITVVCAILIFVLPKSSVESSPTDTSILGQVAKLFPDRLEAVVERQGSVDVLLAQSDLPLSEQPVILVLSRGREVVRVLSYGGRRVCLRLNGQEACVEVLAEGDGNVIVAGKDFVWSKGNPVQVEGFSLRAHILSPLS